MEPLKNENALISLISETELEPTENSIEQAPGPQSSEETPETVEDSVEMDSLSEGQMPSDLALFSGNSADQDLGSSLEISENDGALDSIDSDQYSSFVSMKPSSEENHDLPALPLYVEVTNEQKKALYKLAITKIIEDYKQIPASGCGQSRLPLLARLVAQVFTF